MKKLQENSIHFTPLLSTHLTNRNILFNDDVHSESGNEQPLPRRKWTFQPIAIYSKIIAQKNNIMEEQTRCYISKINWLKC